MDVLSKLRGGLVVSCQALEGNPLRGPAFMAAMAKAAEQGGACGIRANGAEDIRAIRKVVDLPIIGINKVHVPGFEVYITPTLESAREVVDAGADLVAIDATLRPHPGGLSGADLIRAIKRALRVPVMADISTLEEGIAAAEAGADLVATTLSGYTPYTALTPGPDLKLIESLAASVRTPVVAEGRIWTVEDLKAVFDCGAFAAVIGKAITNPQAITERFVGALKPLG
ncbi:MAG: N-acetylmannosamine-6-phosphate 2-epimerase [bacterium]